MTVAAMTHTPTKPKISFDPTINLGHVLTFVGFLIAGSAALPLKQ
jgi:hypothetical protein